MKLKSFLLFVLVVLSGIVMVRAQSTQPADVGATNGVGTSQIEVRALEEFGAGKWASALPLLKKAAAQFRDEPDRLGPIEEKIRVCERNLKIAANTPPQPPAIPSSPEQRKPHPAPDPGAVLELQIKELGNFDYDAEKGGNIPDDVMQLSGTTLRLRGFMIPMDQADSITQFALVPSLFACCFGQPPQIQHTIIVHAPKGKAVGYYPDEITVQGKLKVEEKKEDGFIVSVFEIDCDSVKPVAK